MRLDRDTSILEHIVSYCEQIELTVAVDPDLIGGIRLTMQGVQYDGTVRHHLDELQRILQTSTL